MLNVSTWLMVLVGIACAMFGAVEVDAVSRISSYACPTSIDLTVERSRSGVRVTIEGRKYDLERKRSSIGDKFLSSDAALIIDGDSAIFVAGDRLNLGTCVRVVPVALAR